VEEARAAIVSALVAQGHSELFGHCVVDRVREQFAGAELAFAISVLVLVNPSEEQTRAAVDASGIDRVMSADLPDRLYGAMDTCVHLERSATTEAVQP